MVAPNGSGGNTVLVAQYEARPYNKATMKSKKRKNTTVVSARSKGPKASKGPLVPLHDRVVVRPLSDLERGEKRESGIIIPPGAQEKSSEGVVVAVGPGGYQDGDLIPMTVQVGDRVLYGKYSHEEVKVGGQEYVIVSESNILAVINS